MKNNSFTKWRGKEGGHDDRHIAALRQGESVLAKVEGREIISDLDARICLGFVLREIVGFWDSLDAVPLSESPEPFRQHMDKLIERARSILERENV